MSQSLRTIVMCGLLAGLGLTASTNAGLTYERSIEAMSVLPVAGGSHRITGYLRVDVEQAPTVLDLSTHVFISVNGTTIAR